MLPVGERWGSWESRGPIGMRPRLSVTLQEYPILTDLLTTNDLVQGPMNGDLKWCCCGGRFSNLDHTFGRVIVAVMMGGCGVIGREDGRVGVPPVNEQLVAFCQQPSGNGGCRTHHKIDNGNEIPRGCRYRKLWRIGTLVSGRGV